MKKLHLKKDVSKKKLNKKKILFFLFFTFFIYLSYSLSLKYFVKKNIDIKGEEYVNFLLDESYDKKKKNYSFIVNESLKLFSKLDLSKPETLLDSKISSVNIKENKIKEVYTDEDEYNLSDYEKVTSYISNENVNDVKDPVVYIYNTHQLETYSNQSLESYNITPNVMMSSYLLKEKLTKNGVNTIVEDTNMAEFIRVSGVTHNQFYGSSRIFMQNAMKKYPSLKYFIDIHRDSISKNISTIQIDGKDYARILFVIGKSNSTYEQNEIVSRKISDKINKEYPKLSRGIYERVTNDWKEAYNQDLSPNSMLIEVGAKENTIDEVLNTVDVLSKILSEYIKETR